MHGFSCNFLFYIYIKENNATQTDIRKDFLPLKSQCMGFQKTKEKKLLYFTVSIYIYIYFFIASEHMG